MLTDQAFPNPNKAPNNRHTATKYANFCIFVFPFSLLFFYNIFLLISHQE